jgi:hypothetical protein
MLELGTGRSWKIDRSLTDISLLNSSIRIAKRIAIRKFE